MKRNVLKRLLAFFLFLTVSNSFSQVTIFTEGFEESDGFTIEGALSTASVGNNGWRSTAIAVTNANNWSGFSTGSYPITNRSLMVSAAETSANQYPGQYFGNVQTNKTAYVTINSTGYETLVLDFDWRCNGEVWNGAAYDKVVYRIGTSGAWTEINTGGYSNGIYVLTSNVAHSTINLPVALNNTTFQLGFKWVNDSEGGSSPTFVVDNITIKATPLSTDRTLTVSEAYTGASHANGNHTFTDGNLVTATSGTRSGYTIVGWTGTGSVPATGTGGTASFTITENSSITWIWEQIGTPNNIVFHNYGGADQLAFNNSRINFNPPVFRMSHSAYDATDYEVEISTSPTFTGTYPLNTEANFTFTNGFTPTNGTTYYVRARVRGAANVWSSWTTETYSFTYDTNYPIPNWFQTTQTQFQTDELSGVVANGSHDVVINAGSGNVITNGSFEDELTGWSTFQNWHTYIAEQDNYWSSSGNNSLLMWNTEPGEFGYSIEDHVGVSQIVDLTNVSNLEMEANYESASGNVQLRVYIAETTNPTGANGQLVYTWTPPTGNNSTNINIDLTPYSFIGNKALKLIYYVYNGGYSTNFRYLNIDNVRTTSLPQGTIISTPIHLASVQGASVYQGLEWNQTLNGGEITFKIQSSVNGVSGWTDVPGYSTISATGSGMQYHDLSAMTAHNHIRLFGTLNGANATLHDWAILFDEDTPLPVELTHFSTSCETGETSIRWTTASETNSAYFIVEKSRDGKTWSAVKQVSAAGNSSTTQMYSVEDVEKNQGVAYYRLVQVDFDGKKRGFWTN